MHKMMKERSWKISRLMCLFLFISTAINIFGEVAPKSQRAEKAISRVEDRLKLELSKQGLRYGAPIFIRIFKQPGVLEIWVESAGGQFKLFEKYDICSFSGSLGPKLKQGDYQSPEGFYFVRANQLNPWSKFHLSFNLGYPNKYDRYYGRTGSALMVHGNCVSVGCYAMTDTYIEEIYALAVAALSSGQDFFRVHIFPFRLEPEILEIHQSHRWYKFWRNLKEGYDYFEDHNRPPNVEVKNGNYIFSANSSK